MSQPTTIADIRLNPAAPQLTTTVSQKTVSVRQRVLAPEECMRALFPAIAQPGALQTADAAMHATRAKTQAGAGVARITTQNWPGANVTKPAAVAGCLKLYAGQAGSTASQEPTGLTQHVQYYATRKVTWEGTRKSKLRSYHLQTQ